MFVCIVDNINKDTTVINFHMKGFVVVEKPQTFEKFTYFKRVYSRTKESRKVHLKIN